MAIFGVNIDATDDFVFPDDKENPTSWLLGTLSSRVLGVLLDQSAVFAANVADTDNMKAEFKGSQAAYNVVQFGLRGWTNFLNPETGAPIPFERIELLVPGTGIKLPAVPHALMDLIPLDRVRTLSEKIQRSNDVTSKEGKS